jgi:metal-sulfur cluster biosynthetic enzyme
MTTKTLPSTTDVLECLGEILDPCSVGNRTPMSITEMGLVRDIEITDDGAVSIAMRLTAPSCLMVGHFKDEAAARIGKLDGVTDVSMTYDSGLDWSPDMIEPAAQERRRRHLTLLSSLPPVS